MEITKVTFEYSDGTARYIDREDLEKWLAFNAIVAQNAMIHNCNPPWESIIWHKVGKDFNY